jgi:hypothetical protein
LPVCILFRDLFPEIFIRNIQGRQYRDVKAVEMLCLFPYFFNLVIHIPDNPRHMLFLCIAYY